jgi:uncharacterized Zn finger protein
MAWGWSGRGGGFWRPYVPMWKRREQAAKKARELAKKGGRAPEPIEIEGRTIARTFWGQSWCENLERYSDFENRLPRGQRYVRNGSVIDLRIEAGRVKALVSGSEIYTVSVKMEALAKKRWEAIKRACAGRIDSVVELLEGKLSRGVMEVLTSRETGLFPSPKEIAMECSCPDWATMCKHVAAVLYGVGARLDSRPDLLFILRGVDGTELAKRAVAGAARLGAGAGEDMDAGEMEKVFGIEIDDKAVPRGGAAGRSRRAPAAAATVKPAERSRGRRNGRRGITPISITAGSGDGEAATPAVRRAAGARRRKEGPPPRDRERSPHAPAGEAGGLEAKIPLLLRYFEENEAMANADYRRLFSVEQPAATRELGELAASKFLIRSGSKRGTRYRPGAILGGSSIEAR